MRLQAVIPIIILFVISGCATLRENPKYNFADGRYNSKIIGNKNQKVYVENKEDRIHVYPLNKMNDHYIVDTANYRPVVFSEIEMDSLLTRPNFVQTSLDIDFLTIPFKYRFPANGFPRQFNTNINGAVYLGYRSDVYVLNYSTNPLGVSKRHTTHFGFSFGCFTGVGGTAMNPWVTRGNIAIEYDGVVWTKGVAGIIGVNNFTVGLAAGWDNLLDGNKKHWIYQGKPWLGFAFGLNLN